MSKILQRIFKDKKYLKDLRGTGIGNDLVEDYLDGISNNDILTQIFKDKEYIKSLSDNPDLVNDLVDDYVEAVIPVKTRPTAKEKINYVGIEIECFSRYDKGELQEKFLEHDIKNVQIDTDGSIEPDFGEDFELKVLLKEKDLKAGLSKLGKVVKKGKFGVNDSCGLHIHLDMRNRDVEKCYQKLLKFQDVLFSMVDKDRWSSEYCQYNRKYGVSGHYSAINKDSAYAEHRTIEIRLHHATLDMKKIEKWISLLLTIIGTKNPPTLDTKAKVIKWAKDKRSLKTYLTKTVNPEWFERRKVASGEDIY